MMDVAAVRAHDKNPIMCSSCEDKLPAAARCIECMDFLCHDCRNAHMRLRLTKTHRVSAVLNLLPWSFGLFSALLLNPLLTPIQTEHFWRPNTIKHSFLIKHVDAELRGQTVSNMFDQRLKEQDVLLCLIKYLSTFKFYQTRSNTPCARGKMFGHQTSSDRVWWPNISAF